MADVSSVSAAVASALTGVISSVGESSISRVVTGVDAAAHNLIDGVVSPTAKQIAKLRGYKYRNNGAPGPVPVLTSQQLQVTKTRLDPRIMRIRRDAVNLLTRVCRTSDAMGRKHPSFDDIGAVHLRLTIPVPTSTEIGGFEHHLSPGDELPGLPSPAEGMTDSESEEASDADSRSSGDHERSCSEDSLYSGSSDSASESAVEDSGARGSNDAAFPGQALGVLGNALQARPGIDRLRGVESPPVINPKRYECTFCNWTGFGKAYDLAEELIHLANPSGAKDLYVLDVIIPTELLTCCMETADTLIGEEKPAKNLQLAKVQRKLKRLVSEKVQQHTYNYLQTISQLVVMALMLDSGETGTNHCDIFRYSGEQSIFKDFFANQPLEDAVEDLDRAKKEAGHPVEGVVLSVPAPEVKGSLNEKLVLHETAAFGEYALTEKKPVVGAVPVGVDLLGKPSPNDHKSPLNFIGAVYRHFGDSDTVVAQGTPDEYVIHLDRSEKSKLSAAHERVWDDMIEDHAADFIELLTDKDQRFDFDFLDDGKPNSYCTPLYEKYLEEQLADERFYASDNAMRELLSQTKATQEHMQQLKATAQVKKGEDSSRARAVISPGVAGSEGLHQARTSPLVKALEALHAIKYNHTNLKGMTEETKRIRFAEFLRAVPKGAVVFGTDKSKNDSCFREAVWKKCIKYLAKMADIFEEHVVTRPYVYSANERNARQSFPSGTLDLKYWIIKLTPLLAILLSGIGPTSFINRLESTVENGATVLEIHGEEAYQKWRQAERSAAPSTHPSWSQHPLPHVAEHVEWAPLAPHMVKDTSIKCDKLEESQIDTHHMGINEGDDQAHVVIPPTTDEWKGLSTKGIIMKYSAQMSKTTGFIFEAALTADDTDMIGRNSVFEMLSAWVGLPHGQADEYEVAVIVPKVLKAIRKIPHCTISSQHTVVYDENGEPMDVVRDEKFWSLALTKFYALAIINHESLGVRGLFLAHGDYCYARLERLIGKQRAITYETIYGDRDPERRNIEEAASTSFGHCGVMRDQAHELIASVSKDRVMRVCCTAWRSELPELAKQPKEKIAAALRAFDSITLSLEITDQYVRDPMLLWQELDIGCILEPLVMHATGNFKKVAAYFRSPSVLADAEETVQLARAYASAKPSGAAKKEGRPDNDAGARKGGKKGKGKANGKSDNGKGSGPASPNQRPHKGEGKGSANGPKGKGKAASEPAAGKAKGKGEADASPKGKGKAPRPPATPDATGDGWQTVGRR